MGPTGQEREPSTHSSARCSKEAKTGIQLPFCVLYSLKALGNWMGTAGENSRWQVRKDFWEHSVVSEGRNTRCWMQETIFKVWFLEHGYLTPRLSLHLLYTSCQGCSHSFSLPPTCVCGPPWRQRQPCQPLWQHCPSGNSDI